MPEEHNFLHHITGSFAQPAAENPTVEMVEAAYRHHGLHYRYLNTEVPPEKLGQAVAGARAMNWAGFNCSIPHKVAVIEHSMASVNQPASLAQSTAPCVVMASTLAKTPTAKGF